MEIHSTPAHSSQFLELIPDRDGQPFSGMIIYNKLKPFMKMKWNGESDIYSAKNIYGKLSLALEIDFTFKTKK